MYLLYNMSEENKILMEELDKLEQDAIMFKNEVFKSEVSSNKNIQLLNFNSSREVTLE